MSSNAKGFTISIDSLLYGGMSLRAKTFLMFLAGVLGGALAWMAIGRTGWLSYTVSLPGLPAIAEGKLMLHRIEVGMTIGGLIGLLMGVTDAFEFDRIRDRLRAVAGTLIAGMVFGAIALQLGVPASVPGMGLDARSQSSSPALAAAQTAVAHGVVWAVLGLGIGCIPGLLRRAPMLIRQGAFGGVIGGLASGFVAMMVPPITMTVLPGLPTLPAFLTGGGMIGLFCAGAPYLFRNGSLRIIKGRYTGKEYLICAPITLIGSGPTADIRLVSDPTVASSHCSIEESSERLILRPVAPEGGTFAPTLVNGRSVLAPLLLASGDFIAIGTYRLQFMTRDPAHSKAVEAETITSVPAPIRNSSTRPQTHSAQEPKNLAAAMAAKSAVEITEPIAVAANAGVDITAPIEVAVKPTAKTLEPTVDRVKPSSVADATVATVREPRSADGDAMTTDKTDRMRRQDLADLHNLDGAPKLACLDGPNKGHVYVLPPDRPITIGRGTDRDIALVDDHAASRNHAIVIAANGRHVVRDEGSANGTLLNNLPLKPHDPHRLESNDIIVIGRTVLRYEM